MSSHSYFHYDQMTLLDVEVHSDELELLHQASDAYDWDGIRYEVEPRFRQATLEFREQQRSFVCPQQPESESELQESFAFLEELEESEAVPSAVRNPKGAGRRGQDFLSYLKAFVLAPVLRVEQNCEAIAGALAGNPAFYVACGFTHGPAARTLRSFDQIMCAYDLWDVVHQLTYGKNVEDKVIDAEAEDTMNIDNTHLFGYSTPGKYQKECRECEHFDECEEKVSTDETADWYIKGKYKCYYAHQIGLSQLAQSGAPLGCVVLNGKQYEPDSLEPLVKDAVENHPELDVRTVNADGIFNSQPCRDTVQHGLGEDAKLNSAVNPRRKQDIQQPARGVARITKHGSVQCIAGQDMVFLTKDSNLDAYLFACPVLNEEARCKLEHMGLDIPEQHTCEKQEKCCPNAQQGRIYRVPREMLSQIDWDNPQFSYRFKLEYAVRTKIERLIGRMKCRFKMNHLYKRAVANIRGHILKFYNLMHILANVTGTYGV